MVQLETKWDRDKAIHEIFKRLEHAKVARARFEPIWESNEKLLYATDSEVYGQTAEFDDTEFGGSRISIPYLMKNLRMIHAQLSSNPPSVIMRPSTSDQEDQRRAKSADKVGRHALRKYNLQERADQWTLQCLSYGTGVLKSVFDPTRGGVLEFDKETNKLRLEGDISITTPHIWNIYLDPDARSVDQLKHVIEEIYLDLDESIARWPEYADALRASLVSSNSGDSKPRLSDRNGQQFHNAVKLYEYWETGLASNGYMGRYCLVTSSKEVLDECRPSPFRFKQPGATYRILQDTSLSEVQRESKLAHIPEIARLPYHLITDIDVPNQVYGHSPVEYCSNLQRQINNVDSAVLENLRAHGAVKLVLHGGSEMSDPPSDSTWDVYHTEGGANPYHMQLPGVIAPGASEYRQILLNGLNDAMGVNESMSGQQSREQAAAAMQFAVSQGNQVRRRLFNKYVLGIESLYKAILDLGCKHWSEPKLIQVLGKENILDTVELRGIDIDGGYDVVAEYGTAFSLDPATRRQDLMMLQPWLKEAGVPTRRVLSLLRLSELEVAEDDVTLADSRQQEIFARIIATEQQVNPEPFMDHEHMVAYALRYFMSAEFNNLNSNIRMLCKQHIGLRVQLAAEEKRNILAMSGVSLPGQAEPTATELGPELPVAQAGSIPSV